MTKTEYVVNLMITTAFYLVFLDATIATIHFFLTFVLANVINMCDKMHTNKARMQYGN